MLMNATRFLVVAMVAVLGFVVEAEAQKIGHIRDFRIAPNLATIEVNLVEIERGFGAWDLNGQIAITGLSVNPDPLLFKFQSEQSSYSDETGTYYEGEDEVLLDNHDGLTPGIYSYWICIGNVAAGYNGYSIRITGPLGVGGAETTIQMGGTVTYL